MPKSYRTEKRHISTVKQGERVYFGLMSCTVISDAQLYSVPGRLTSEWRIAVTPKQGMVYLYANLFPDGMVDVITSAPENKKVLEFRSPQAEECPFPKKEAKLKLGTLFSKENRTGSLSTACVFPMVLTLAMMIAAIAIYCKTGVEVFWLVKACMVAAVITIATFLAFIVSLVADFCGKDKDAEEYEAIDADYAVLRLNQDI